jgi:hypothetical protein
MLIPLCLFYIFINSSFLLFKIRIFNICLLLLFFLKKRKTNISLHTAQHSLTVSMPKYNFRAKSQGGVSLNLTWTSSSRRGPKRAGEGTLVQQSRSLFFLKKMSRPFKRNRVATFINIPAYQYLFYVLFGLLPDPQVGTCGPRTRSARCVRSSRASTGVLCYWVFF